MPRQAASAPAVEKWNPSWESEPAFLRYINVAGMPHLQRFKIMLNQCRGVPKISLERVHIRSKPNESGGYRSVVSRVFGANNHIRFEIDQGIAVLQRVKTLLLQLRKFETVIVDNVSIVCKDDDIVMTRTYKKPNILPVTMSMPIDAMVKIIDEIDKIEEAAKQLTTDMTDLFQNVDSAADNNNISKIENGGNDSGKDTTEDDGGNNDNAAAEDLNDEASEKEIENVRKFRNENPGVLCAEKAVRFDGNASGGLKVVPAAPIKNGKRDCKDIYITPPPNKRRSNRVSDQLVTAAEDLDNDNDSLNGEPHPSRLVLDD